MFSLLIQYSMFSLIIDIKTSIPISTGYDTTLTALNRNSLKLVREYTHNLLFSLKLNEDKKQEYTCYAYWLQLCLFKLLALSLLYSAERVLSDIGVPIMWISLRNWKFCSSNHSTYFLSLFMVKNTEHFKSNSKIHSIHTRHNNNFRYLVCNLTIFQKSMYYFGIKFLIIFLLA
jgi:hypothetical protein